MKNFLPVLAVTFFFTTGPAYAFLDPGTDSFLLQALIGSLAGALVMVKLYWARMKKILGLHRKVRESLG